jgi:hypothetical protein
MQRNKRKNPNYKQGQIESEAFHKAKLLAVKESIQLRLLLSAMVQYCLEDEKRLAEILAKMRNQRE